MSHIPLVHSAACRYFVSAMPFRALRLAILAVVLCALSHFAAAQELTARPVRGLSGKGGYQTTDIDAISLQNGSVNVQIPLASLPPVAGGKLSYTLTASYNSKLWDVHTMEKYGQTSEPGC